MRSNIRIKVSVADLIAAVQKAKSEAVAYNLGLSAKNTEKYAAWKAKVLIGLERNNAATTYHSEYYSPEASKDTTRFDKDIALLKLSADETITISANSDFYRYIS